MGTSSSLWKLDLGDLKHLMRTTTSTRTKMMQKIQMTATRPGFAARSALTGSCKRPGSRTTNQSINKRTNLGPIKVASYCETALNSSSPPLSPPALPVCCVSKHKHNYFNRLWVFAKGFAWFRAAPGGQAVTVFFAVFFFFCLFFFFKSDLCPAILILKGSASVS